MSNVTILDLETIPDYSVWLDAPINRANGNGHSEPSKKPGRPRKTPLKDPFPPCYAHQIVSAGLVVIQDGVCCGVGTAEAHSKEDEKRLLEWLATTLAPTDKIITWNGRHFDMPVIQLRSLHHGVAQPWLDADARSRYKERHIDLCDIMTEYGGLGKTGYNLDTFSQLIGMPGKGDVDGSMVKSLFESGKMDLIIAYNKRDCVQTAALWYRWELLRGRLDVQKYREGVASLLAAAREHEGMEAEEFRVNQAIFEVL